MVMRISIWLLYSLGTLTAMGQEKEDFKLVKKDERIFIYERWTIFPKSNPPTKAREVKTEFTLIANLYDGLHLIQNESKIQDWQNHVSEFKVYKQRDTTTWFEYSYHNIPWPVSDQDHFLQYHLTVLKPNNLFVTFQSKVDAVLCPVREGVDRMDLSGSWQFEQLTPSKLKVTYRILSMPSSIPKFLTDPIIRNNMMSTITSYMEILEHKKK